jgi:two-component system OmpR family sensor kinase
MAGQPLIIEPVNMPRLLEDLMVNLGPAADAKGIVLGGIVREPAQDVPHISADASVLREVFSNLLENAVKHNGSGTAVTAEVRQQGNGLLVRIADTGKGISPELLSHLSEKGGSNYRPRETKGGGMGLYLCKLLVELHGGEIAVKSVEGKGTEFHVLLPLRRTQ